MPSSSLYSSVPKYLLLMSKTRSLVWSTSTIKEPSVRDEDGSSSVSMVKGLTLRASEEVRG